MRATRMLLASGLAAGASAAILALLAVQTEPSVPADAAAATPAELLALRQRLRAAPMRPQPGGPRIELALTARELSMLSTHLLRRQGGSVRVRLLPQQLLLEASLPLTAGPVAAWVNLKAQWHEADGGTGWPRLTAWRVGRLPLPAAAGRWLERRLLDGLDGGSATSPRTLLDGARFATGSARLGLRWRGDPVARWAALLAPPGDAGRLRVHHERLANLARAARGPVDLITWLQPLFDEARRRSPDAETALAENRAVLQVLAWYLNGRHPAAALPEARDWPRAARRPVLLAGREDFPQHFVVSAWLALEAGAAWADAMGTAKEMDDARAGSGFSFTDLAVNRAGRRLGEALREEPQRFQQRLATGVTAAELLPAVADLPEFMPEAEFRRRFASIDAPASIDLLARIDARIDALALYEEGAGAATDRP